MSSSAIVHGGLRSAGQLVDKAQTGAQGIRDYHLHKIQEAEQKIIDKTQNLRRLEAQRNSLNAR
ncbi:26S protease regulatory subunit 8, partial [Coemansia aciculifera]